MVDRNSYSDLDIFGHEKRLPSQPTPVLENSDDLITRCEGYSGSIWPGPVRQSLIGLGVALYVFFFHMVN